MTAMLQELSYFDHYALAAFAICGTFGAAAFLFWFCQYSRFAGLVRAFRGVSPPFLSVIGVLFALNLAFLANDTWIAHDRALNAVYKEAGSLRSIELLTRTLPPELRGPVDAAMRGYVQLTVTEEWPLLARRQSSAGALARLEGMLSLLSGHAVASALNPNVHRLMLEQVVDVRAMRELRIVLSQTHINPLKWMGVAFLGLLTMIAIAMVHVDQPPRGEILAILLFASSAAPTAAIVLVQGNPYQAPAAVTAEPLAKLL
ncbi:DUF4239 domain-containing protein [Azospirillaceae bacterium]